MGEGKSKKLSKFVSDVVEPKYLRVEEDLGHGYVRLKLEELERRQVKQDIRSVEDAVREFLRNSRDAGATKIFISSQKEAGYRRDIVAIDDGCGIPKNLHEKIFEPRVTTKLETIIEDRYGIQGRGMALYSVKSNLDGQVKVVSSLPGKGTCFKAMINTTKVPEKKDQSTFPTVKKQFGKPEIVKGPHNLLHLLVEFIIAYPGIEIFYGTPSEILATMRGLSATEVESAFPIYDGKAVLKINKLWHLPVFAIDVKGLIEMANKYFGLEISNRNAYRIFKEIEPLRSINSLLQIPGFLPKKMPKQRQLFEKLSRRLSREDLEYLATIIANDFKEVGKKYFLTLHGKPKISLVNNEIVVKLKILDMDDLEQLELFMNREID